MFISMTLREFILSTILVYHKIFSNKGKVTRFSGRLLGLLGCEVDSGACHGQTECHDGGIVVGLVSSLNRLRHEAGVVLTLELRRNITNDGLTSCDHVCDVGVIQGGLNPHGGEVLRSVRGTRANLNTPLDEVLELIRLNEF